jgi:anti-anti-sigma regulatory factor
MLITVSQEQGQVPVTVLRLHGDLDSTSYVEAIQKAQEEYDRGARHLVLDLSKVPYMSSAGLMSLHSMALLYSGHVLGKGVAGRPSYRALNPELDDSVREHVKLVGPQPRVVQVLDTVGLKRFFEVFDDVQVAVNAF